MSRPYFLMRPEGACEKFGLGTKLSILGLLHGILPGAADGRGGGGQFVPAPQCEGAPKQCWTRSNEICFISHIPVQLL